MAVVGRALLIMALGVTVYGIAASLYGARRGRRAWVEAGRRAVYPPGPPGTRAVLVPGAAVLRQPVRDDGHPTDRGRRPRSPAPSPQHDDPPPDAVLGLHAADDPVRLRSRRAGDRPARRGVDRAQPALRPGRLAVPRHRNPA